jgi:hypothetical protein
MLAVATLGLLGAGAWLWRQGRVPPQAPVMSALPVASAPTVSAPTPSVAVAPVPVAPPAVASEPAVKHAIDVPVAAAPLDVEASLVGLFGRKAVLSLFQLPDFPRRFVATVDNLGRAYAPASLWPVNPAGGRFVTETRDGAEIISADNSLRYTPHLLLLEQVDLRQAVAVYVQLYPVLQQAYQAIGYPNGRFNDRLIEVIDVLLATPERTWPLKVRLPVINGPLQPARPWVTYEFDDPALQALSSGQRTLLRMGPVNQRRVKARLVAIRRLIISGAVPR